MQKTHLLSNIGVGRFEILEGTRLRIWGPGGGIGSKLLAGWESAEEPFPTLPALPNISLKHRMHILVFCFTEHFACRYNKSVPNNYILVLKSDNRKIKKSINKEYFYQYLQIKQNVHILSFNLSTWYISTWYICNSLLLFHVAMKKLWVDHRGGGGGGGGGGRGHSVCRPPEGGNIPCAPSPPPPSTLKLLT